MVGKLPGNIVPAGPVRKRSRFPPHDSLQMIPKYKAAIFDIHRQIRVFVYTRLSGSNLRFNSTEEISYGNTGASC